MKVNGTYVHVVYEKIQVLHHFSFNADGLFLSISFTL